VLVLVGEVLCGFEEVEALDPPAIRRLVLRRVVRLILVAVVHHFGGEERSTDRTLSAQGAALVAG
jgi:hypothetical protein